VSVALRADEDSARAGRDVEVRRDAVEVMEAVDVVQEDGLGREADPTGKQKKGALTKTPNGGKKKGWLTMTIREDGKKNGCPKPKKKVEW